MDLIPLDYATLRVIWWALLGILLIGFAIMDGFDLGVATLLPFVARDDLERRMVLHSIAPVWEGNQVWLILGGGAIFAAFPMLYAVSFSGFYLAMFLILMALILRPVGFNFRDKVSDPRWRSMWDWGLFISGFVPALVFGVAMGNVLVGVPFHFDSHLRPFYTGNLLGLLNPFALLAGVTSLTVLVAHGAAMINMKIDGEIARRAARLGSISALASAAAFVLAGVWLMLGIKGYRIDSPVDGAAWSNPLLKQVTSEAGLWMGNHRAAPMTLLAPLAGIAGALLAAWALRARRAALAFSGSTLAIIGIMSTLGVATFPFLLPSSTHPHMSLTLWDASSSPMTLWIMLLATAVLLPVVIAYTAWVYRVLHGKITPEQVERESGY